MNAMGVNTSKYLDIKEESNDTTKYELDNYINKDTEVVKSELNKNGMKVLLLGNGDKVINQYPSLNISFYPNSVVVLLGSNYDKKMRNLVGLSYKDAINILKLMQVKYELNGNGYVVSQSIQEGSIITDDMVISLALENGY